ncbi:MAG: hypothetical protein ABI609_14135 [Acidobacteriota bacterium]
MTDLIYALIQLGHNFGALAVTGIPVAALAREGVDGRYSRRLMLWLVAAWALQVASGSGFALASWTLKGALPEVEGIALVALSVKIGATVIGLGTAIVVAARAGRWTAPGRRTMYQFEIVVALVPLAAAAFLRWYL